MDKHHFQGRWFRGLYDETKDDVYVWASGNTVHEVAYQMIGREQGKSLKSKIHLTFNLTHRDIAVWPDNKVDSVQNSPVINKLFPQFKDIHSTNG